MRSRVRRGDIAWFHPPSGPNSRGVFVKRIIGPQQSFRGEHRDGCAANAYCYWSLDEARNTRWSRTLRFVRYEKEWWIAARRGRVWHA
jgi:hypothetical protein